ncbi:hypothetical protein OAM69_04305 [bacterium]|nr:hypothetical protein [bacterium]
MPVRKSAPDTLDRQWRVFANYFALDNPLSIVIATLLGGRILSD